MIIRVILVVVKPIVAISIRFKSNNDNSNGNKTWIMSITSTIKY